MRAGIFPRPSLRRGFTLVELLTVIAIIAILAGLLFPVVGTARENARKSGCMSNLISIIQGLEMYKEDHGVYPDALYGISVGGGPFQTRLYPSYVKDRKVFVCPNSLIPAPSDDSTLPQPVNGINRMTGMATPYLLADFSSYDLQSRPTEAPQYREIHYNRKWTLGTPGLSDDGRQLIYRQPPDSTVVTWCLYHTSMNSAGDPSPNHVALVAFKSGRVQSISADKLAYWPQECINPGGNPPTNCPWQVLPKP